jgi:hypothetical protein
MPQMGFEPTIPVFEWAKTVHALDRAAAVIYSYDLSTNLFNNEEISTTGHVTKKVPHNLMLFQNVVKLKYIIRISP